MVQLRDDVVGLDAAILMAPKVWEASGHVATFTDPLVDCRNCKERFRADQLPESGACPNCGAKDSFTEARQFNLMFKTFVGPVEDDASVAYLRPETAQGIFVNFANVQTTTRKKPPFGIAQIGKSFRNEITPGNFIFRTREFEQMEMEYFVPPEDGAQWYEYWCQERLPLVHRPRHPRGPAAPAPARHRRAVALLGGHVRRGVRVPVGLGRARGHRRTAPTTTSRSTAKFSGQDLTLLRPGARPPLPAARDRARGAAPTAPRSPSCSPPTRRKTSPTARAAPRSARCCASTPAWRRSRWRCSRCRRTSGSCRWPTRSPALLRPQLMIDVDVAGSIGRRYRRQDEVGTPLCVTVDFDTLDDRAVTIRDRDTMDAGARARSTSSLDSTTDSTGERRRPIAMHEVPMSDNYYEVLGVEPDARHATSSATRTAQRRRRPRGRAREEGRHRAQLQAQPRARSRVSRSAWNVLSDPFQRQRYDASASTPTPAPTSDARRRRRRRHDRARGPAHRLAQAAGAAAAQAEGR